MLITLPDHDITTFYLSKWSEEIIKIAEKNGMNITLINGPKVNVSYVTRMINTKEPSILLFNAHGSDTTIGGQNNEPIIELGKNDKLLNSKMVHVVSCNSARKLGKKCGAKSFIGYDDIFWLYMDGNKTNKPLKDEKVKPILESALEAPKQIIKRKSAGEAYEKSQKMYQKNIDELTLSSSKHTAEELQVILPFLHWNKDCQKLYGDPNARI